MAATTPHPDPLPRPVHPDDDALNSALKTEMLGCAKTGLVVLAVVVALVIFVKALHS